MNSLFRTALCSLPLITVIFAASPEKPLAEKGTRVVSEDFERGGPGGAKSSTAVPVANAAASGSGPSFVVPQARLDEKHRVFFKDYCVECHNADKQKGRLRLDDIAFAIESVEQADRWQKILNQLNSGEMPPEDEKQPQPERKTEFLDALSNTLVTARKVLGDQGGQIAMRRLNRREYKNTIRDLLGVEIDVRDLPADGGTGAFDTVGASLFMSGDQIEQYLALGRRALDEHFARSAAAGVKEPFRRRTEAEEFGNRRMNSLFKRTREQHDNYVKWTAAVEEAAKLPANVATAARLREEAKTVRPAGGLPYAAPLMFYHGWDQMKGAPSPAVFGFRDAQAALFEELQHINHFNYYADYQKLPGRDIGAWLLFYMAYRETYVEADKSWPAGRYTLRMRVAGNEAVPAARRFIETGQRGDVPSDLGTFTVHSAHQVTGTLAEPQVIELTLDIGTLGKREFALREKRPNSAEGERRAYYETYEKIKTGPPPAIWVDWFEIEGPASMPTGTASLAVRQQDSAGAREMIERFATRAFRGRRPDADYLDHLMRLFEARLKMGGTYEDALKEPLCVVLASPGFLYLHEPATGPPQSAAPKLSTGSGTRHRISSLELATRLAYFLWSAPPDDALLALASSGELQKPAVLAAQVDRMIASGRSREFVSGFAHQWLGMDRLDFFQFDFRRHRGFDDSAKAAARGEVYETISHLLRGNLSLRHLLKSDFVIINGLLAGYYGLDGVTGDAFRKVKLPPGSPRGGLLGMAAILAMGGNGTTTSPVERGAWVLRKLLHDPPPPAPPNVPQLARLDGKPLSVRERMLAHQEEPQCASCHRKIDPIGFGLENFDAAGLWRTEDRYEKGPVKKSWPVDPAAAFHNGPAFKDYFALRDLISAKSDVFARGFTEALIEYALGRPFGFTDEELAAGMMKEAKQKDFALGAFIHALVASDAFHSK
ncbi:MAG: DUF1592 domain-containing protein [Prosthecobacter sp.]